MITTIDNKTALVLIDLQKGIASMPTAHPAADVIAKAAELVKAFREKELPIVYVNVNPVGSKWTQVRADQPSKMPKDPEAIKQTIATMTANGFFDLVPEIDARETDIHITKHTWSAFFKTDIHQKLQELEVSGIVLAGIATSIGVEGTARDANMNGYNLTFASDAMTDLHASAHEHSLSLIFPRIGEVGTTEEIITKLNEI